MLAYLKDIMWEEGKIVPLPQQTYRHVAYITCTASGVQSAEFANGIRRYFANFAIVTLGSLLIPSGINITPVLPDGRILMVIQKRGPHGFFKSARELCFSDGTHLSLGKYESVEMPGGAIEPGQNIWTALFLELLEETGIPDQTALVYRRLAPVISFGADLIHQINYAVAFLSSVKFSDKVETDGGIRVVAFTFAELEENILRGVINSGQSALASYAFLQEVLRARADASYQDRLLGLNHLTIESVKISRT